MLNRIINTLELIWGFIVFCLLPIVYRLYYYTPSLVKHYLIDNKER